MNYYYYNYKFFFSIGLCGAKEFGNPSSFHIKPKAHAEEEEMSEDE